MTGAVIWGLVLSSLGVIVVRRRSVAIALVAAQSLGLGAYAFTQAIAAHSTALLVAGAVLLAKARGAAGAAARSPCGARARRG